MILDDPLQLPVLWGRLIAIVDESAAVLVRAAFSSIIREANDYTCMLLDRDGGAIADNSFAVPAFIGCVSGTMRHALAKFPHATWRPGDVVITNDPWIATGHLPDFTVIAPIFRNDRLVGFAASVAHLSDCGGALWSADTTELYEEGIRIPLQHLYHAGQPNAPLFELLRANIRVPELVIGDIEAMIAANRITAERTLALMSEEGLPDLVAVSRGLQARAETAMRRAIATLPEGRYESHVEIDGWDAPLTLRLSVTIANASIALDYAGTSPEQRRAINVPINNTFAMNAYVLKCLLDPTTPRNEGTYRPITVTAPSRSLVNAQFPAPVNARHLTFLHFASCVMQALAPVLPNRVIGESGNPFTQVVFSGRDLAGDPFVYASFDSAGMGARAARDGLSATPYPNNTGGAPVEIAEATSALLIHEKALIPDSGGAGRHRGGLGTRMRVELHGQSPATISVLGDRITHPA
ncbi:MAG: hydantoinase B/oxoprolinase family protein, partial [Alphaproteobacteria bacterium]|nr:hydantoinase B/oxoprolinase family protein [Alphaproteobacteria bacterium]